MSVNTDTYLKGRFETLDVPTEQDFIDLIDSKLSLADEDFSTSLSVKGTPIAADRILIEDSAASYAKKYALLPLPTGVYRTHYVAQHQMVSRTTNGAASGTTELATNDVMLATYDFDTTTEEGIGFWWTPPQEWDLGTVLFKAHWTAASGSGTAQFDLSGLTYADDDPIDAASGTAVGVLDTLITANDMHISPVSTAVTIGGTPAAGQPVYFQVTRNVATDTLGVDAKLIGISIQYLESSVAPAVLS